jgi:hypothetical protein
MELTLQFFLKFLKNLISFFRKQSDHLFRRLWHIFATFRLRFSSQHPKKTDKARRRIQSRSAKPSSTAVICASRLPPPLTPIACGDSPVIASPSPISIQVRQPTALNSPEESNENNADCLDADGFFLGGSRPGFTGYHDEPDSIHDSTSTSPVTPSRPDSRLSSGYSVRPASQYRGYNWPESQYSHRQPSERSYRPPPSLNGAESAARGFLPERQSPRPSSPVLSVRAPSFTGSVASRVYRANRPTTRVRRPSPLANAPRRERRSPTPASARHSVHEIHPDVHVPEPPQSESQTTGTVSRDRNSVAVSFAPSLAPPPEGTLRPAIGIDRYEKQKQVVIEEMDKKPGCLPVTTEFAR